MTGCRNGGSCVFDEEKESFACSCTRQWRGEKCDLGTYDIVFQVVHNTRGPTQCVCVSDCYFIVNVLDLPFASPITIYR